MGVVSFFVRLPDSLVNAAYQLAVTAAAALLVFAFPRLRTPARLLVVGVVATALLYRAAFPAYLFLCATIYLVATRFAALRIEPPAARWKLFVTAIVLLGAVFVAGRAWQVERYGTQLLGVPWALYYLDMWMLLRLVSFLWEVGSGRLKQPAPSTYALWIMLPFTAYGPLLRFSEFAAQLPGIGAPGATNGLGDATWWRRVGLGIAQLLVGAAIVAYAMPWASLGGLPRKLAHVFVFAPWSFYLLSAGVLTLMECLGRTWGLTLPRSFDRAFGRPNISEFWANWNMSATNMFRDYLFYNRWGRRTMNVYFNVIVLFFLVGVWHNSNAYWMIWGLLHGIGFATFLWYKKWRTTPAGQRSRALPRPLAIAVTYVFVCACWAAPPQIIKIFSRLA